MTITTRRDELEDEADLTAQLRSLIVRILDTRSLTDPEELARALGVVPAAARSLLTRQHWSVEESIAIIRALNLPISISVSEIS